jgi:hypothetical protein
VEVASRVSWRVGPSFETSVVGVVVMVVTMILFHGRMPMYRRCELVDVLSSSKYVSIFLNVERE